MKRCPTCNKTFTDQHLSFCVDDGTPLAVVDTSLDEATVVRPAAGEAGSGGRLGAGGVPPYQPPGSYLPPGAPARSGGKKWPWILGILTVVLLVFAGLGIAAVILIPNMMRRQATTNARNANVNIGIENTNRNSGGPNSNTSGSENDNANDENGNTNDAANEDTTPPPTEEQEVLSDLKDLEDDWTVANINADKKKLNRILADDYVDKSEGKSRGKAEYLKTAQRDNSIQKWAFEDLKVSLKGDRATLSGIVRFDVKDQQGEDRQAPFTFTDKFVWRDGRWQATGSEVNPMK